MNGLVVGVAFATSRSKFPTVVAKGLRIILIASARGILVSCERCREASDITHFIGTGDISSCFMCSAAFEMFLTQHSTSSWPNASDVWSKGGTSDQSVAYLILRLISRPGIKRAPPRTHFCCSSFVFFCLGHIASLVDVSCCPEWR